MTADPLRPEREAMCARAHRMRSAGRTYVAIARDLGMSVSWAQASCRDLPPSSDPRCHLNAARRRASEDAAATAKARTRDAWVAVACGMRLARCTLEEIAGELGIAIGTAGRATAHLGVNLSGKIKTKPGSPSPRRRRARARTLAASLTRRTAGDLAHA